MQKTIVGKNGHSISFDTKNIIVIDAKQGSRIIIHLASGDYITILGYPKEKEEELLKQLQDDSTSEIKVDGSVKRPLSTNPKTKNKQQLDEYDEFFNCDIAIKKDNE